MYTQCTRNDAFAIWLLPVQPEEVSAIERQDCPMFGASRGQDIGIGHPLTGTRQLGQRHPIVGVAPERLDPRQ
ncbi:MAG TPA: hypothetical protein VGD37_39715 [Kofleriaceae bacterium]|jgi:hypothetical protein